jgi:hypothetical protein
MTTQDHIARLRKVVEEWKARADKADEWSAESERWWYYLLRFTRKNSGPWDDDEVQPSDNATPDDCKGSPAFLAACRLEHPKLCDALLAVLSYAEGCILQDEIQTYLSGLTVLTRLERALLGEGEQGQ